MSDEKPQDDIIDIEPQVISDSKPEGRKPRRNGLLSAGLVGSIALLAALSGGWFYRDVLANYLPNDELHALAMRVDALEAGNKEAAKRVDAVIALTDELKAQVGAAQAAAAKSTKESSDLLAESQSNGQSIADMRQALDQARADLESLKTQLANNGSGAAAADPALVQRLDALEKSVTAAQGSPVKAPDLNNLKQAIAALSAKVADGAAFSNEFALVAQAVPAADGLDVLKAEAQTGVPNAKQLAASLNDVRAQLPKATSDGASNGWLNRIGEFFSNLVTVQSIGSDDWPTLAAKASALVAAGDLPQADALFASMEGQPPAPLSAWHETLQRRIKLDAALEKTKAAVAREIAAKG